MRLFRRLKAKRFGIPYLIKGFYVYTAWWAIQKEPQKWGWAAGVAFPNDFIRKLYAAERGDVIPLATVGNLIHEYKLLGKNGVPGSDHLPGGSVDFDLVYWRTLKADAEINDAMEDKSCV